MYNICIIKKSERGFKVEVIGKKIEINVFVYAL